jgi:uncharacterized membrane protein YesL
MDPSRPGKGVDKDEPQKKAFFRYWALVWRKFTRFITLNFIYFVVLIPLIALVYLIFNEWLDLPSIMLAAVQGEEGGVPLPGMIFIMIFTLPLPIPYILIAVSVVLYGPATCGFIYILRNFYREEHAWTADFFTKMKENFKQGLIIGLMEIVFFGFLVFSTYITRPAGELMLNQESTATTFLLISRYITIGIGIVVAFMHYYAYLMIVTFNLKVRQILKNALIFAVMGLWRNLLSAVYTLLTVLLLFFLAGWLSGILEVVILGMFLFALPAFACIFAQYPIINKFMIQPVLKAENPDLEEDSEAPRAELDSAEDADEAPPG